MKKHLPKLLAAGFIIATFVVYSLTQRSADQAASPASSSLLGTATKSGAAAHPATAYKDGRYTGTVADAVYGPIEVAATITGGKLTDVEFLQYPNDRPTSVQISTAAMPQLKQEALTAQAATVDIISGATDTTKAFNTSLQAALEQAQG